MEKHNLVAKEDEEDSEHKLRDENDEMMVIDCKDVFDEYDTTGKSTANVYKWYNVNFEFLPAKLGYFFDTAKKMGYLPNMILFLTSLGLSNSESGIILGSR